MSGRAVVAGPRDRSFAAQANTVAAIPLRARRAHVERMRTNEVHQGEVADSRSWRLLFEGETDGHKRL